MLLWCFVKKVSKSITLAVTIKGVCTPIRWLCATFCHFPQH